jgi:hypothetical protein
MLAQYDGNVPSANDLSLFFANGNIISNNHKLDVIGLIGVVGGVLLLGETEVEDVSCVVSGEVHERIDCWV